MTKIVIVGGGFGGLRAVLDLEKIFRKDKSIELTLIDKRDYHLFTPNLFEVAASEEELTSVGQMKRSVTLPFEKIFKGKNIKFIKSELEQIDPDKKILNLGHRQINYDYLILALGSESNYLNVAGARKFSLSLKNLPDALRIRNQIGFAIEEHRLDARKKTVRVVVAGGGYTGVELAGELKGLADFLAWKNQYPREKIEIEVIESANMLVPGFDDRLSKDVYERLRELGVRVRLSARVASVERNFVTLMSGDRIAYDVLLWTTGIKAVGCQMQAEGLDIKGRLPINEFFQVKNYHNVFALGDLACVLDGKGRSVPPSAQDAGDQAKYLAAALPYIIKNQKPPRPYKNIRHGFIVNVGGKWAVMSHNGIYLTGRLAYFVDKLANIRYYASLVGIYKAIKNVIFQVEIYSRNA